MIQALALAVLLPGSARAASAVPAPRSIVAVPLEDACENEINLFCRRARSKFACLSERIDSALPQCKLALDAEEERLAVERAARQAVIDEARMKAQQEATAARAQAAVSPVMTVGPQVRPTATPRRPAIAPKAG